MIVDSLFVEEDRLICVVATSKLTDEDRDSLVHSDGKTKCVLYVKTASSEPE